MKQSYNSFEISPFLSALIDCMLTNAGTQIYTLCPFTHLSQICSNPNVGLKM